MGRVQTGQVISGYFSGNNIIVIEKVRNQAKTKLHDWKTQISPPQFAKFTLKNNQRTLAQTSTWNYKFFKNKQNGGQKEEAFESK